MKASGAKQPSPHHLGRDSSRPYTRFKVWRWLWLALSLWAMWAIRAHQVLALPVFVDESLHILRTQVVYDFSDAVASFLPGKLLTYYYLGFFDLQNHNGLWLARQAIALLAPLSAALCYALVYQWTRSYWAGVAVVWLYALNPALIFFERMALSDPFVAIFALGLVWASWLHARRPHRARAIAMGALLGLALLAKLTALPLGLVPLLAWWLQRGWDWQWRRWVLPYSIAGAFLLLPALYVVYQEAAQLEDKQEVVTTTLFIPSERTRLEQIGFNLQTYASALTAFSAPMVGLAAFGLVALWMLGQPKVWRAIAYLGLILALSWGFIVLTSAFPSTRYLTITYALTLVMTVLAWQSVGTQRFYRIILGILVAWGCISSLIFIQRAWADPAQLQLGQQDEWEYFSHTSSGYGLRAVAPVLSTLETPNQPVPVLSTVGSCHSLRFYLPAQHRIQLYCPYFGFWGNPILLTQAQWQPYRQALGYSYLLSEDPDPAWLAQTPRELLGSYPRPHQGETVYLFRIGPNWTLPNEQP